MNQGAGERLPWLSDEPATVPASPRSDAPPAPRGRGMWPWYLLFLLLVGLVGAGTWWLGTRQREAPPPQLPPEAPLAIPVPPPAPAIPDEEPADELIAGPSPVAPTTARERPSRPVQRREPARPVEAINDSETFANVADTAESPRSVFPADEPAAGAPPLTGPSPVVVYHPQRNRGRVVQLGAFPTRAQADEAWKRVTRRYPYLATKPKMVNTVDVRAIGGGRRTRMYRLQLGTSSQAQSVVICQQLERAGQSCVVVY